MRSLLTLLSVCAAALLLAVTGSKVATAQEVNNGGDLQRRIRLLERQNKTLQSQLETVNAALGQAKKQEAEAREELNQVRTRLQALGIFGNEDNEGRLVAAIADKQAVTKQLTELQASAMKFKQEVQLYLRNAVAADPDARLKVESSMRGLDVTLGLRDKPGPRNVDRAHLNDAKVVSIDPKSGMLVLNIGSKANVKVGMPFRVMRGERHIAEAIVAEVRPDVSGVLVQKLINKEQPVRVGDSASVKIY